MLSNTTSDGSFYSTLINFTDIQAIEAKIAPLSYHLPKSSVIEGLPDGILALIAPLVAYWTYSSFFHIIDEYKLAEKYRIHPSEEMLSRNRVSLPIVIRDVIFQHVIQSVMGYALYCIDPLPTTGYENFEMWQLRNKLPEWIPTTLIYLWYWYGQSLVRMFFAFLIIDSWQFHLHRIMHLNKALYKRFHSRHHQLYVPYAYGALFNDPVEGFLLDTLGTGIASLTTGMTPIECTILYTFSTMKTVDDHCGYSLPFDLFQLLFPNNSIYHDIHHQHFGVKYNFSQPFFTFWDTWFGTTYHGVDEYKTAQEKITLQKYRQFLQERKNKRRNAAIAKKMPEPVSSSSDEDEDIDEKKTN
ncbi:unnamed protein product [Ambrosiozyma monospora]|uniref:Unnamed protein product n=1 Tax=Ambrosiozyma monospora TaxID=43982 RepID=A0A9W6YRN3_AMBMO|nr:unnamed protein product [Ambrosiozyma monospora]